MSPFELSLLIHIHTTPRAFDQRDTPLRKGTLSAFVIEGIIVPDSEQENGYVLTELGRAFLSAILSTRIPELAYVDQSGRLIEPL